MAGLAGQRQPKPAGAPCGERTWQLAAGGSGLERNVGEGLGEGGRAGRRATGVCCGSPPAIGLGAPQEGETRGSPPDARAARRFKPRDLAAD